MSLPHVLLGLLWESPSTGYDLARSLEKDVAPLWRAEISQIYPALARLRRAGFVLLRVLGPRRGPRRNVYRITAAGRRELKRWISEPAPPPSSKDEGLTRLAFADALPPAERRALLARYERVVADEIRRLRAASPPRASLADGRRGAVERLEATRRWVRTLGAESPLPLAGGGAAGLVEEAMSPLLGAVVPAAGRSRRMGREKALLPWGHETSLERVLGALSRASLAVVCVVLRPDLAAAESARGAARRAGASVLVNPDPDGEMLDSIRIGAAALPSSLEAFFVWPVDHPLVAPGTLGRLAEAAQASHVAIPTFGGRRGHPALVGMELLADLLALPRGSGLRDLWHGGRGSAAPAMVREVAVDDPGVVTNVDTPEQYAEALRALGLGV